MFDALSIGATGMQAQQLQVETIANNLSNVNTTGFKKGRVAFADLIATEAATAAAATPADLAPLASAQRLGSGVGVARIDKLFDQGDLKTTGGALDVAINGAGFLQVTLADGTHAFSRGGNLKVNSDGFLVTPDGQKLDPPISIPANARSITISAGGQVTAVVPGQGAPVDLGQLEFVRFGNPGQLQALGNGLYRATDASGEAIAARPGQDDSGTIVQGAVEGSNVKMVDEMVGLVIAQRAYEANVKVVQAADEMLGMINNLRK